MTTTRKEQNTFVKNVVTNYEKSAKKIMLIDFVLATLVIGAIAFITNICL
jgi:hypothetical protein